MPVAAARAVLGASLAAPPRSAARMCGTGQLKAAFRPQPAEARIGRYFSGFGEILREGRWDRDGHGWTRLDTNVSHRACDTWRAMKTAATIDVTVPENRKLELELPPEVPAGKAKLLVMVEEQPGEAALPEAHLVERDGFLLIETPSEASLDDFDHRKIRDERIRKLAGMP